MQQLERLFLRPSEQVYLPLPYSEARAELDQIDAGTRRQLAVHVMDRSDGMPGSQGAAGGGREGATGTFPEQVMNSALQYQIAKPIVDAVMKDAGLSNEGITGMAQSLAGMLGGQAQAPQPPATNSGD